MDSKINALKEKIHHLKKTKGPRTKIPTEVWSELATLSEARPLKDLCLNVGLSFNNARIKIKKLEKNKETYPQLFQLPSSPNPVLEMVLKSGTVIKVFDQ